MPGAETIHPLQRTAVAAARALSTATQRCRFRVRHVAIAVCVLTGCAQGPEDRLGEPESTFRAGERALVDTRPWLIPVANPPLAWQQTVAAREDVIRHRFVRFGQPDSLPEADSRFLVAPFPDAEFELTIRRAGPIPGVGYSWFGMFQDDPRGFGGVVVRPNRKVSAELRAPDGRRFAVANVGENGYAILEVAPEEFRCGVGDEAGE